MATGGEDGDSNTPNRRRSWRKRELSLSAEEDTQGRRGTKASKTSRSISQIDTETIDTSSAPSTSTGTHSYPPPIVINLTTPPVTTALEARNTEPPRGRATVHISINSSSSSSGSGSSIISDHTIGQDIPIRIINRFDQTPVDQSVPHMTTPNPYNLRPRRPPETTPTQDSGSVIIVDSDSDDDDADEVIIVRESPPQRHREIAQHIQDIIGQSVLPEERETFGTTISVRTIERQRDDLPRTSPDSLSVLMVAAVPPGGTSERRGPDHHHHHHLHHHHNIEELFRQAIDHLPPRSFMTSFSSPHPIQFLHSIIGSGGPFFGGAMGSYEDLLELAERLGPGRSLGLPDDAIDAIPVRIYKQGEETCTGKLNCVICMSDYEEGDNIKTLSCAHEFHTNCISPWLKQRRTCPICRNDLITS